MIYAEGHVGAGIERAFDPLMAKFSALDPNGPTYMSTGI